MVQCKRCGKNVQSSDIQYLDATTYVCGQCFLASKGQPRVKEMPAKKYDASPVTRITMVCGKCGYQNRFRDDSGPNKICSYCGSKNLSEKTPDAAKFLAEADDDTFEY